MSLELSVCWVDCLVRYVRLFPDANIIVEPTLNIIANLIILVIKFEWGEDDMVSNKINEYKDAAIITIITVKNRINDFFWIHRKPF